MDITERKERAIIDRSLETNIEGASRGRGGKRVRRAVRGVGGEPRVRKS